MIKILKKRNKKILIINLSKNSQLLVGNSPKKLNNN